MDTRVRRQAKHDDIAALGAARFDDLGFENRQSQTITKFLDEYEIAFEQRRHH